MVKAFGNSSKTSGMTQKPRLAKRSYCQLFRTTFCCFHGLGAWGLVLYLRTLPNNKHQNPQTENAEYGSPMMVIYIVRR